MSDAHPPLVTLFLDANVLISAAWKHGAEVAGIWQLENVRLVTSIYVMAEVQRNLPRVDQIERLRGFMTSVEVLILSDPPPDLPEADALPAKDRPVLAGAVQAKADFLITGDKKHFSQWFGKNVAGVRIEPPTSLLSMFHYRHRTNQP